MRTQDSQHVIATCNDSLSMFACPQMAKLQSESGDSDGKKGTMKRDQSEDHLHTAESCSRQHHSTPIHLPGKLKVSGNDPLSYEAKVQH
ncbi:hypothetical protein E2C01_042123 [Portunus trituberculatus]|uniref:Uncharacterized protein n=1 Tax=Portunus trituberculatus TaxID=210409 RepID=A0A5B7FVL5_PORTR|nr:hypothetical protein [Portunus trituberculatus]